MTADPNEPDTFAEKEDVVLDEETPEADAAEQHTELQQHEDEQPSPLIHEGANDADALEQTRVVAVDEDDYR
ncbi:hypothetical protein ACFU3J_31865 [Streptomyces sp. NPDC057411]|uniref:hypothetical protein n=1 Tax=unclassified Streptomyces TaxID=2593676 RepID=UPI0036383A9F